MSRHFIDTANRIGWDKPNGGLHLAMFGVSSDDICGEWMDDDSRPCGRQPDHPGDHSPIRPCCHRAAERCSC